jgi:hypothetical protein
MTIGLKVVFTLDHDQFLAIHILQSFHLNLIFLKHHKLNLHFSMFLLLALQNLIFGFLQNSHKKTVPQILSAYPQQAAVHQPFAIYTVDFLFLVFG